MSSSSKMRAALLALACTAAAAPAAAGDWQLSQAAYNGGGVLVGSFSGADADGNGWLSSFDGEITAFQAAFSGDAGVGQTSFDLGHLAGLVYRLDGGALGDDAGPPDEGLLADNGSFQLAAGLGAAGVLGGFVVNQINGDSALTELPITVSAVPEPAAAILLGTGLALLTARRQRRDLNC